MAAYSQPEARRWLAGWCAKMRGALEVATLPDDARSDLDDPLARRA